MPQFEMRNADAPTFRELSEFVQAYIEAIFFTECEPGTLTRGACSGLRQWNPETDSSLPGDVGVLDLAPESFKKILFDCTAFQRDNAALLVAAYAIDDLDYTAANAGHDYWLTRNGHGSGFWSRTSGEGAAIMDALSEAAVQSGEVSVSLGDDGKVYVQ